MTRPDESFPGLRRLLQVMRQLRDPEQGCPWDLAQDSRSLARYTLEEAYEVVAAIEQGSAEGLRGELGDLLFQIVFHAQLASERGDYDFDAVAGGIADKLTQRHPHVFTQDRDSTPQHWEGIKADERRVRGLIGALADVPDAMPALSRAAKLGRRAADVGFDWSDSAGARAKVLEELDEIATAQRGEGHSSVEDEMGDLLLAATSLARHLQVDPETALRRANSRFEKRFAEMERIAISRALRLPDMSPAALDDLWREAKTRVQS
jgi:nucleoside triphosphate diphosphatase